jgi:hypothetical protein
LCRCRRRVSAGCAKAPLVLTIRASVIDIGDPWLFWADHGWIAAAS